MAGGSAVTVSVVPGAVHAPSSWLHVPDMYVSQPPGTSLPLPPVLRRTLRKLRNGGAVAESYIYITAFAHDEFGNPCAPPLLPAPGPGPSPPPGRRALDFAIARRRASL